jgi:Kef-type K+ transport system membrane component KefB
MSFGILALIVLAGLAGPLLAVGRRGFVPVVVGELAAGVVIGRTGTAWLDPSQATVAFLADIGFAMLMFAAGMHVPLRTPGLPRGLRRGTIAALVVIAIAVPAGLLVSHVAGTVTTAVAALLLAGGSAAILLPILEEEDMLGEERALTLMAQIAVADVVTIVALPIVMEPSRAVRAGLGTLAVAVAALAVFALAHVTTGHPLVHRFRHASKQRGWALDLRLALVVLFGLAWLAVRTGTSILVAGFAVGLVVAAIGGPKRLSRQVTGIAAGFFVPLFFVVLGARLDFRALVHHPAELELTALLVAANVAARQVAALVTRQSPAAGLAATAQLGLPAGVATLGLEQHAFGPGTAAAILLAALATIALSPLGVALMRRSAPAPTAGSPS